MKLALAMDEWTDHDLQFAKQIGVTHLVTRPACFLEQGHYTYESLAQFRERVEAAGLEVAASHNVPPSWNDRIRQGLPGRNAQLERYCQGLANMARTGIPMITQSFHPLRVWRTGRHERGRGDALFTSYDHSLMQSAPPLGPRAISDEETWDHYAFFAREAVPCAEAAGVKIGLHPDDPPMSPIGEMAHIFSTMEAFQCALDMVPSPAVGLVFCQGCFAEMLGTGVYEAIRYLGGQGKVFGVHFRNVVGQLPKFREAFIDGGDIDMLQVMRLWQEVGFDGWMIPDHHGLIIGDSPRRHRSRAHAIGYMKALMLAVGALGDAWCG